MRVYQPPQRTKRASRLLVVREACAGPAAERRPLMRLMRDSTELEPVGGWASFGGSAEVTDALWALASGGQWHYLNLYAGSSIWESRRDASTVVLHYDRDGRIVHLTAEAGHAAELVAPLVARFGLIPAAGEPA